jgi:hypothetical protein
MPLSIIPLTIVRLVYISSANSSSDRPFNEFNAVIATQIGVNLDAILTCLPFLRTFMEHVQHGVFTSDLRKAPGYGGKSMMSYAMGSVGRSHDASHKSQETGATSSGDWKNGVKEKNTTGLDTVIMVGDEDNESRASSGNSDTLIIKQTNTITVQSTSGERRGDGK